MFFLIRLIQRKTFMCLTSLHLHMPNLRGQIDQIQQGCSSHLRTCVVSLSTCRTSVSRLEMSVFSFSCRDEWSCSDHPGHSSPRPGLVLLCRHSSNVLRTWEKNIVSTASRGGWTTDINESRIRSVSGHLVIFADKPKEPHQLRACCSGGSQ